MHVNQRSGFSHGRRTHGRWAEIKNSRESLIKMNQLRFNKKELNEAIFSFFYNETLAKHTICSSSTETQETPSIN